jgi:hypothetical protein
MSSERASVRRAIESRLYRGQILKTPGRGYPPISRKKFMVTEVGPRSIKVDKLRQTVISYAGVENAVSALCHVGGTAEIGGYNGWAKPGTFERFLQDARESQTRTATYVVPILVEAGVVEYVPRPGPKHIRLTKLFAETTT